MIRFNPSWKPMSNWIIFPPATETGDDTSLFFLRFSDRRNFHLSESFPRNSPHHPSPSSTFFGFFRTFQTLTSARATPLVKTPKEIRLGSLCLCVCVCASFFGWKTSQRFGHSWDENLFSKDAFLHHEVYHPIWCQQKQVRGLSSTQWIISASVLENSRANVQTCVESYGIPPQKKKNSTSCYLGCRVTGRSCGPQNRSVIFSGFLLETECWMQP